MPGPTDDNERQPSAASSSTTPSLPLTTTDHLIYDMVQRLCPDEIVIRRQRPGKLKSIIFRHFHPNFTEISFVEQHYLDYSTTNPSGNPTVYVPYEVHSPTKKPQLFARFCIPVNQDVYEFNSTVVPLSTTTSTTTTSTSASTQSVSLPSTSAEHLELLHCEEIPAHIAPYFIPKVIREGTVVKLVQYRYDAQRKAFCWHVLAQPLREPKPGQTKPQLRLTCPNLDKKFTIEEVLDFLRYFNINSDGSYYKATPEVFHPGRGFGKRGDFAPATDGKLFNLLQLVVQHFKLFLF